jgi:1,2-diacylglycerol 3-alpha-glucosyltransferase
MRIALVSTGLGRVLRGFESFTESLFQAIRHYAPYIDVTLFQGGGKSGKQRLAVPNLHRNDIPARWFGEHKGDILEKRTFALLLYPVLLKGGFDIVHYNGLVMGSALFHLRKCFGGSFKLLYCNGAPSPPVHYSNRCDFAQVLTEPAYREATTFGMAKDRLFLVPYGVDSSLFSPETKSERMVTRQTLGIPENAKVILTVGALKREHKRIDYVIREVSAVEEKIWLVAAGERTKDTSSLEKEAENLLPGRWRFVSWPHHDINRLYGAVDVFVLASLNEGFGLVTVEALLSGLPVIIHSNDVNDWIAHGTSAQLIDMSEEGALRNALAEVGMVGRDTALSEVARKRFSWKELIPVYSKMYKQISELDSK